MATGYCLADTADKSYKGYTRGESLGKVAITSADVFLWQMLASVFIPGFTINRLTYFSARLLRKLEVHKKIAKYLPTAIGVASIPVIIHPIDNLTDILMDNTYRKLFHKSS